MAKHTAVLRAALGLRAHSGWAALVALAGSSESAMVVTRRRIETADPAVRGSKQPFHAAEPLDLQDAETLIKKCTESTRRLSRDALKLAVGDLRAKGFEVGGCGVILGSGRSLPALPAILASHALLHTAEGEFYRQALVEAGEHCGLRVVGVKEREAYDRGAAQLGLSVAALERRIAELGRGIGPPWTQDQKYAALVGWMALTRRATEMVPRIILAMLLLLAPAGVQAGFLKIWELKETAAAPVLVVGRVIDVKKIERVPDGSLAWNFRLTNALR